MTPQRRAVLEVLIGNTPHPTAEQIHGLVGDFEKVKSLFPCDGFRPVRYAVTIYGYCADYAAPLETES
jgi:Fe2+ or Zn2+ uptake regulation protein